MLLSGVIVKMNQIPETETEMNTETSTGEDKRACNDEDGDFRVLDNRETREMLRIIGPHFFLDP